MSREKEPSPPMADDRSTKKAKFRAQGDDGDMPEQLSFRDKLMESQKVIEEELIGREEELIFEPEDMVIGSTDNIPSIDFSQRIHAQLIKPWQHTVVVKLLGRHIGYRALCNRLGTLWNSTLGFSIIDLENNYFLVRFKKEGDAEFALTQGPWTIMGHYLVVQPWNPHFDASLQEINSVVAWIRLPGMALHYYHKRVLRMLGQIIGKVIRIDYNTESAMRGKFARIAVEVVLNKPLVSQFLLDGKLQKVEYESLPHICFNCGRYGHNSDTCPELVIEGESTKKLENVTGENIPEEMVMKDTGNKAENIPKFGPWMVATRKGKNRHQNGRENMRAPMHGQSTHLGQGSRFGILETMDDSGMPNGNANGETSSAALADQFQANYNSQHANPEKKQSTIKRSQKPNRNTKPLTQVNNNNEPREESSNQGPITFTHNANTTAKNQTNENNKPNPMNTPRNLRTHHANHIALPKPRVVTTSLNPLYHSAVSFADEPPDADNSNYIGHVDDDENDSDYIGDSDEGTESSDGDVSLEDENAMEVAEETLELRA